MVVLKSQISIQQKCKHRFVKTACIPWNMAKAEELRKFYIDLNQEIINKAAVDETEDFRENIFTQIYIDYLCEAAEIEDGNVCYHEANGVKINGYSLTDEVKPLCKSYRNWYKDG